MFLGNGQLLKDYYQHYGADVKTEFTVQAQLCFVSNWISQLQAT